VKLWPCIARVRIVSAESRWPTLWLPLFLTWPLVLVAPPLAWLGFVVWASLRGPVDVPRAWPFIATCYEFVCALSGTRIELAGPRSQMFIAIS
jgi:hypothetical protein